jgi:hypothetical protein
MRSWLVLLVLALAAAPVAAGCGTDAQGVQTCKDIEEARCRAAVNCPSTVQLTQPYTTNGSDVDACIRYYDVACLHGLAVSDVSGAKVSACVKAISTPGACAVVANPELAPDCSWLIPPNTPAPEAGEAGDASDASDAGDAGDGNDLGDQVVQFPDN